MPCPGPEGDSHDYRCPVSLAITRRQGRRTETLTLEFRDHGSCDVSDAVWRKYIDGQKIKTLVRASSGDVVCSSL